MYVNKKTDILNMIYEEGEITANELYELISDLYASMKKDFTPEKFIDDLFNHKISIVKNIQKNIFLGVWYQDEYINTFIDDEGVIYRTLKDIYNYLALHIDLKEYE